MLRFVKNMIQLCAASIAFICISLCVMFYKSRPLQKPRLVWGPIPIKSWGYASQALSEKNFFSKTLMHSFYNNINSANDFDYYTHDLFAAIFIFKIMPTKIKTLFLPYLTFCYALKNFDIFHFPMSGGYLADTLLKRLEAIWLRIAGKKIVILPYGADFYQYSLINNPSLRHVLLDSYPKAARHEKKIADNVAYWIKNADTIVTSIMIDGLGRWDLLPVNYATINTRSWIVKKKFSHANGENETVNIVHTPNHRSIKGTEFLLAAIDDLKRDGMKLNLILLENVQNEKVKQILIEEADILVEQFIGNGYALSAIEGMATGLPVVANLTDEWYTRLFRRYSYLSECPILSATAETIKKALTVLIKQPDLRRELGIAGRKYVEKYHSNETAQFMFGAIYDKIWYNKEVDLINLFHPLKSSYVKNNIIRHPLIENCLPDANRETIKGLASCALV